MPITINGSAGTITGVSTGGLPDGCVDADTLASGANTNKILQVVTNTLSGSSSIAADAESVTASGLITTVTTQGTGSSFLVSSVGANPHCNDGSGNSGVRLFLYASVNSGSYANVFGSEPFQSYHASVSWVDFPGTWTVHVTGLSYTVGQTIAFQPYFQEGQSAASTNYFHHTGGSGSTGTIRLTVQEVAA